MAEEKLDIIVRLKDFATNQFKTLEKEVAELAATAAKVSLGGLALGAAGLAAFGAIVKHTAEGAERLRDFSKELQVSVEFLSEMEFAVGQSGASLEELTTGIKFLQKELGEFRLTGKGALSEVLNQLSPSFRQIVEVGRPAEEVFTALGVELQKLSASERVFVASKLFSRGGPKLIQLLTEDFAAARLQAKFFGETISTEAAEGADKFGDSLKKLGAAFEGISRQLILPFLPQFASAIEDIANSIAKNRPRIINFFADVVEGMGNFGENAAALAVSVEKSFGLVSTAINVVAVKALQAKKVFLEATEFVGGPNPFGALTRAIEETTKQIKELQEAGSDSKSISAGITAAGEAIKASATVAAERLRELAKEQQQLIDLLGIYGPHFEDTFEILGTGVQEVTTHVIELDKAQERALDKDNERFNHLREETSLVLGLRAGVRDLSEEYTKMGAAARQALNSIATATAGDATDALIDYANGTKRAKAAFRDFASSVLKDIQRIIIQTIILKIVQGAIGSIGNALSGSGASGWLAGLNSSGSAPATLEHARGGVVDRPTFFAMGGRRTGVAGEAGPEAILPLRRDSRGRLGVTSSGGGGGSVVNNITINNNNSKQDMTQQNADQILAIVSKGMAERPSFRDSMSAA